MDRGADTMLAEGTKIQGSCNLSWPQLTSGISATEQSKGGEEEGADCPRNNRKKSTSSLYGARYRVQYSGPHILISVVLQHLCTGLIHFVRKGFWPMMHDAGAGGTFGSWPKYEDLTRIAFVRGQFLGQLKLL